MSLEVRNLSEQIVTIVRDRIIAGGIAADAPIRQDALAAELGVSKIPLREALARLEQDGLIVSHANRGFFVRPLSAEEAYDVFALRLKIEPDAVAFAADRADASDHAAARAALASLDAAVQARTAAVGALNRAFHMALIRPGGRLVTMQVVERLQVMAERYVHKHLETGGRSLRAAREHAALLAAWSAGDAATAGRLAAAHIADTLADLRAQYAPASAGDARTSP